MGKGGWEGSIAVIVSSLCRIAFLRAAAFVLFPSERRSLARTTTGLKHERIIRPLH
jgi:hypothetical protein